MSNTYEMRDNSGSLFKNQKKEKDSHPNATGKAMIDGKLFWVSAWTKQDRNGNAWQSLAFKPVEEAVDRRNEGRAPSGLADLDDSVPF